MRAADNQMVWRWDNTDPFGVIQPNPNPAGLGVFSYNLRFPGQLYDAETGLNYNYHRTYEPGTGGYTQSDPIGLQGGLNTYAYVGGNPVNAVDPTGENAVSEGIKLGSNIGSLGGPLGRLIGAGIGAGLGYAITQMCTDTDEDECEKQLEREEMMCELLAGPRYWKDSKQAVAICKKAAFVRYTECLKGIPERERSPLTGVDTPI